MITLYSIITIALCHYIFDFKLQTDEMAKGKSTSSYWLTQHVLSYSYGLVVMGILNCNHFSVQGMGVFILVNAILHWLVDYVTSRASSLLWKEQRVHEFFDVIGADQFVHYVCLYGTFVWAMSFN